MSLYLFLIFYFNFSFRSNVFLIFRVSQFSCSIIIRFWVFITHMHSEIIFFSFHEERGCFFLRIFFPLSLIFLPQHKAFLNVSNIWLLCVRVRHRFLPRPLLYMITSFIIDDLLIDELLPLLNGVLTFIDTVVIWTGCGLKIFV